jgi:hypothetical protein
LQFQLYDGALPVRCFLNISSNSSSRMHPLPSCISSEVNASVLRSATGGFAYVVAVNSLGSTASSRVPLSLSSACRVSVRVQECSDAIVTLRFDYFSCDNVSASKLVLTTDACSKDISISSILSVHDISSFPSSLSITSLSPSSTFCAIPFVGDERGTLTQFSTAPAALAFMQNSLYSGSIGALDNRVVLDWEYPASTLGCSVTAVVRTYCLWDSSWHSVGDPFVVPCAFQTMSVLVPSYWATAEVEVRSTHASCRSSSQAINVTINATSAVFPLSVSPLITVNSSDVSRPSATIIWSLTKVRL